MSTAIDSALQRVRTLGSGVGSVALGSFGARAAGLLGSIAAASLLGAREFGQYALLLAVTTVVASLGGMGLSAPLTRSVARAPGPGQAASVGSGAVLAATGTLATLGLITVLVCWPRTGALVLPGGDDALSVAAVGLWIVGLGCNPLLVAVLVGLEQYRRSAAFTFGRGLAVALAVTAACLVSPTAGSAAAGTALAELAAAVVAYAWLRRRGGLAAASQVRWSGVGQVLRVGVAAGAVGLAIQASMWVGQVLVSRTPEGVEAAGLFLLASRLTLAVTFVPNALATVVIPRMSRVVKSREDPRARLSSSYLILTITIAAAVAFVVTGLATWLVPRLHEGYSGYSATLALMGMLAVVISLNNVYGSVIVARGLMGVWICSDVMLAAALFGGALWLVADLGVTGLALAYVLSYALSVGVLSAGSRWGEKRG